ncbi:MAG TPA: hypothetical protein VF543_11565 [Pyrinomonadaceae bacterium]|jgi:photosystem II stability/assembly factor-like uncharacterized protein
MAKIVTFILFAVMTVGAASAQWAAQVSGTQVRLRGVSAVSRSVAWASGDKGTYARTTDGGKTWVAGTVPGASELDFRDVDAFDADTAYLLAIGEGEKSRIYKTTDGGKTWELQFKSSRPGAFFDSMAFWDSDNGIAVSDPVGGRFLIIKTSDGGRTWNEMPSDGMPAALAGEGAFAASGTSIAVEGKRNVWFGTGGPEGARIFRSTDGGRTWAVTKTPVASGKSAGIFSVTFWNARRGVAVGGDYTKEREAKDNVAVTSDGGRTWTLIKGAGPAGYRSCVAFVPGAKKPLLIAVGPSGSEYSTDRGQSWTVLGAEGFHSTSFASIYGWAVGEGGRVAVYSNPRALAEKQKQR